MNTKNESIYAARGPRELRTSAAIGENVRKLSTYIVFNV
jgi:hypothetical protein